MSVLTRMFVPTKSESALAAVVVAEAVVVVGGAGVAVVTAEAIILCEDPLDHMSTTRNRRMSTIIHRRAMCPMATLPKTTCSTDMYLAGTRLMSTRYLITTTSGSHLNLVANRKSVVRPRSIQDEITLILGSHHDTLILGSHRRPAPRRRRNGSHVNAEKSVAACTKRLFPAHKTVKSARA